MMQWLNGCTVIMMIMAVVIINVAVFSIARKLFNREHSYELTFSEEQDRWVVNVWKPKEEEYEYEDDYEDED